MILEACELKKSGCLGPCLRLILEYSFAFGAFVGKVALLYTLVYTSNFFTVLRCFNSSGQHGF